MSEKENAIERTALQRPRNTAERSKGESFREELALLGYKTVALFN